MSTMTKKRRRHTPEQIIRKLAEGNKLSLRVNVVGDQRKSRSGISEGRGPGWGMLLGG